MMILIESTKPFKPQRTKEFEKNRGAINRTGNKLSYIDENFKTLDQ